MHEVGTHCHSRSYALGTRVTRVNNIAVILQHDNIHQHMWQHTYQGTRWGRIVILGRKLYGHVLTIPHTYCNMRIYIRTYGRIYTRPYYGKIYTRAWGSKVKLLNKDLNKRINLWARWPESRKLDLEAKGSKYKLLNEDLNKRINLLGQVARILKSGPEGLGLQSQAFE